MKKISLWFLTVCSIFVINCCKKEKEIEPNVENKFTNIWYSLNSNLIITENNKFEYIRFDCVSKSTSNGKWEIKNDTIILNSFESNGCYFYEKFEIEPPKPNEKFENYENKKSKKDCVPNQGFVIFKNEKFYLKNSNLVFKSKSKNSYFKKNPIYIFKRTKEFH